MHRVLRRLHSQQLTVPLRSLRRLGGGEEHVPSALASGIDDCGIKASA